MVELLTTHLRIRDHVMEDLGAMHRLLSDPVAMRFLPDILTDSLEDSRANLQEALLEAEQPNRRKWFFAVTDRTTGAYCGEVGFTVIAESAGYVHADATARPLNASQLADSAGYAHADATARPLNASQLADSAGYVHVDATARPLIASQLADSSVGNVAQLGYFLLPDCWGKGVATEAVEAVMRFAFTEANICKLETGCLKENTASERVMQKLGMVCEAQLKCHTLHEGVLKDRVEYRMMRQEWEQRHLQVAPKDFPKRVPTCKPEAILFDYGQTLIDENGFDALAGTRAVLQQAVENPEQATAEEVQALADALLREIGRRGVTPEAQHHVEFHNHLFYRYLYESFGMRFTRPIAEVERIFWDTAAPGVPAPGMTDLLAYLRQTGIRTGVISNISFSGDTLTERIERLFPDHRFDFILASSEYVFRKPHSRIFRMALRKLHLPAHQVWYCGDHGHFDVHGSAQAGLFPVWYTGCHPHDHGVLIPGFSGNLPVDPCLEVKDWSDLPRLLAALPEEALPQ